MQISIKKLDGDTFFVSISTGATVQGLKTIIHEQRNVEVDRQRLIYRAQELRNEVPLSQYGIQTGSTLHLVIRRNLPPQNQVNVDIPEFSAFIHFVVALPLFITLYLSIPMVSVHAMTRKIAFCGLFMG